MRDALADVLMWPMDHFWQSMLITMPVAAAAKYAWGAFLVGLDRFVAFRR